MRDKKKAGKKRRWKNVAILRITVPAGEVGERELTVGIVTTPRRAQAIIKGLIRQNEIRDTLRDSILALPAAGQQAFMELVGSQLSTVHAIAEGINS